MSKYIATTLLKFFCISFVLLTQGCGDPYEKELPVSGIVSEAEAREISSKLKNGDAKLFIQWAERMRRGEHMRGELTALNVKTAIINQSTFIREEDERIQKKIEEQKQLQKQVETVQLDNQKDNITDQEIRNRVKVRFLNYTFTEVSDRYGRYAGFGWVFNLKFHNSTRERIIGMSGIARITSAFDEHLGDYPF